MFRIPMQKRKEFDMVNKIEGFVERQNVELSFCVSCNA